MRIRVVLADNDERFCKGLRFIIDSQSDMEVVGQARDEKAILHVVEQFSPHIAILNIKMNGLYSIDTIQNIIAVQPLIKVVAIATYPEKQVICELFKAGASGFFLKSCFCDEVEPAIRTVMENQIYLSDMLSGLMFKFFLNQFSISDSPAFPSILTAREREVLRMAAGGKSSQQIALKLNISTENAELLKQGILNLLFKIHAIKNSCNK